VWLLGQLPWTRRRTHSAWSGLLKTNRIYQAKTFQGEDRKLRYVFGTDSLRRSEVFLPREVQVLHTCLMNMSKANVRTLLAVEVSRHSCELCVSFHFDKAIRALCLRLHSWRLCCHALTYACMAYVTYSAISIEFISQKMHRNCVCAFSYSFFFASKSVKIIFIHSV